MVHLNIFGLTISSAFEWAERLSRPGDHHRVGMLTLLFTDIEAALATVGAGCGAHLIKADLYNVAADGTVSLLEHCGGGEVTMITIEDADAPLTVVPAVEFYNRLLDHYSSLQVGTKSLI